MNTPKFYLAEARRLGQLLNQNEENAVKMDHFLIRREPCLDVYGDPVLQGWVALKEGYNLFAHGEFESEKDALNAIRSAYPDASAPNYRMTSAAKQLWPGENVTMLAHQGTEFSGFTAYHTYSTSEMLKNRIKAYGFKERDKDYDTHWVKEVETDKGPVEVEVIFTEYSDLQDSGYVQTEFRYFQDGINQFGGLTYNLPTETRIPEQTFYTTTIPARFRYSDSISKDNEMIDAANRILDQQWFRPVNLYSMKEERGSIVGDSRFKDYHYLRTTFDSGVEQLLELAPKLAATHVVSDETVKLDNAMAAYSGSASFERQNDEYGVYYRSINYAENGIQLGNKYNQKCITIRNGEPMEAYHDDLRLVEGGSWSPILFSDGGAFQDLYKGVFGLNVPSLDSDDKQERDVMLHLKAAAGYDYNPNSMYGVYYRPDRPSQDLDFGYHEQEPEPEESEEFQLQLGF